MDALENLKTMLGIADKAEDQLLQLLLDTAEDTVLDVIGRDTLPERLASVVTQLAAVAYNRRGTEGAASQSEGGVSVSYLDALPPDVRERLRSYPRKVGSIRADA